MQKRTGPSTVTEIRTSKQGKAIHPLPLRLRYTVWINTKGELHQAKLIVEVEVGQFTYSLKCFKMCSEIYSTGGRPPKNTMCRVTVWLPICCVSKKYKRTVGVLRCWGHNDLEVIWLFNSRWWLSGWRCQLAGTGPVQSHFSAGNLIALPGLLPSI